MSQADLLSDADIASAAGDSCPAGSGPKRRSSRSSPSPDSPRRSPSVGRLVEPSEAADHHPDLTIHYRRVSVSFTTHSAGGLTEKDFAGARAAEEAAR